MKSCSKDDRSGEFSLFSVTRVFPVLKQAVLSDPMDVDMIRMESRVPDGIRILSIVDSGGAVYAGYP